ncbi:MAG: flagellar basal body rod protein FlgC [Hyphomonadaceae bacterium]
MSDLSAAMAAAASGMRAQTLRMRITAENVANSDSTGQTPGADPFRRRIPILKTERLEDGAQGVKIAGAEYDQSDFKLQYNPGHPAADDKGYVKLPNVESLIEMMDLREASRAYEANLNMIDAARAMTSRALDLLRR